MAAQPDEDPRHERAPTDGTPANVPRRRAAPSPYRRAGALEARPNAVTIPPGHQAVLKADPTSVGFLGGEFSMDSLLFWRWAAVYFHSDLIALRVLIHLVGSQQPGGRIDQTQGEIARALSMARTNVNRAIKTLSGIGIVHMPKRGSYQLNPAVALRGGMMEVDVAPSAGLATTRKSTVRKRVDQLDLLAELLHDPRVADVFNHLSLPAPSPKKRGRSTPEA